jgi:hypothetical protein
MATTPVFLKLQEGGYLLLQGGGRIIIGYFEIRDDCVLIIPPEDRLIAIALEEDRGLEVAAEARTIVLGPENREVGIVVEDRLIDVEACDE